MRRSASWLAIAVLVVAVPACAAHQARTVPSTANAPRTASDIVPCPAPLPSGVPNPLPSGVVCSGPSPTPTPAPTPTPTPTIPPGAVTSYTLNMTPGPFAELADGRVVVSSSTNNAPYVATVVLLDPATGQITQLETVSGASAHSAVAGTDGQVWVAFDQPQVAQGGPIIRRYSASGSNVNVTLQYFQNVSIESASDQRLFATGSDINGHCGFNTVDGAGTVVTYPADTICAWPEVRGSDNGMWTLTASGLTRYSITDFSSKSYPVPPAGPNAALNIGGVSGSYLGLVDFNRVHTLAVDSVSTSGNAGPLVNLPVEPAGEGWGPDGSYWLGAKSSALLCRLNPSTGASRCYDRGNLPQAFGYQAGSRNRLWFISGTSLYKLDVTALGPAP